MRIVITHDADERRLEWLAADTLERTLGDDLDAIDWVVRLGPLMELRSIGNGRGALGASSCSLSEGGMSLIACARASIFAGLIFTSPDLLTVVVAVDLPGPEAFKGGFFPFV